MILKFIYRFFPDDFCMGRTLNLQSNFRYSIQRKSFFTDWIEKEYYAIGYEEMETCNFSSGLSHR